MTNPNDGAFARPAQSVIFPNAACVERVTTKGQHGLSKRELFAAMAMQGMISNPALNSEEDDDGNSCRLCANCCKYMAEKSIQLADALIAELNKEPSDDLPQS